MRILVVSGLQAGSQFANAINTVKMAEGFALLGHEVSLICFRSLQGVISTDKLNHIYGLKKNINWIQLPQKISGASIDEHWGLGLLSIPIAILLQPDFVFTRTAIFTALSSKVGFSTAVELHSHPNNQAYYHNILLRATKYAAFKLVVTISPVLAEHYCSRGVPKDKIIILPDAVDTTLFLRPDILPLSPYKCNSPNITYVGHLYDYKGIPTILETASLLPQMNFHLIGGFIEDITKQKLRAESMGLKNVTFHGLKPISEVPPYLWHADVLLLPPSKNHPSALWTSPLKLGEYLASGTPIVATEIPALKYWLTKEEVEFVIPDDPVSMANGIKRVLSDFKRVNQMRELCINKALNLSYEKRAQTIINFINKSENK